jgi:hypothetical protein
LHTLCVFDRAQSVAELVIHFHVNPNNSYSGYHCIRGTSFCIAPRILFPSLRLARQSATNNDVRISLDTELWLSDEAERAASFAQTIRRSVNLRCVGGECGWWV